MTIVAPDNVIHATLKVVGFLFHDIHVLSGMISHPHPPSPQPLNSNVQSQVGLVMFGKQLIVNMSLHN